jgi:hypothetical protein
VVLVLLVVNPAILGASSEVDVVPAEVARGRALADAGDQEDHTELGKVLFDPTDVAGFDGLFRKEYRVDAVDTTSRLLDEAFDQADIDPLPGFELEEAERLRIHVLERTLDGPER